MQLPCTVTMVTRTRTTIANCTGYVICLNCLHITIIAKKHTIGQTMLNNFGLDKSSEILEGLIYWTFVYKCKNWINLFCKNVIRTQHLHRSQNGQIEYEREFFFSLKTCTNQSLGVVTYWLPILQSHHPSNLGLLATFPLASWAVC